LDLVHRCVLFLDKLIEFRLRLLEGSRQPIKHKIIISRAQESLTFPTDGRHEPIVSRKSSVIFPKALFLMLTGKHLGYNY